MRQLHLFSFYRWGNWGPERLSKCSRSPRTQGRSQIWTTHVTDSSQQFLQSGKSSLWNVSFSMPSKCGLERLMSFPEKSDNLLKVSQPVNGGEIAPKPVFSPHFHTASKKQADAPAKRWFSGLPQASPVTATLRGNSEITPIPFWTKRHSLVKREGWSVSAGFGIKGCGGDPHYHLSRGDHIKLS